jgi:hypothetical protein
MKKTTQALALLFSTVLPVAAFAYPQIAYDTCDYYFSLDKEATHSNINTCVWANKTSADWTCDAYFQWGFVSSGTCEEALAIGGVQVHGSVGTDTFISTTQGYGGGFLQDCQKDGARALVEAKQRYDECLSLTDWELAQT